MPEERLQVVEAAAADDHQPVSLDHLDRAAVVGHDPLQLAEDRLDRVLRLSVFPSTCVTVKKRLGALARALRAR